jgi:hypothetical protein
VIVLARSVDDRDIRQKSPVLRESRVIELARSVDGRDGSDFHGLSPVEQIVRSCLLGRLTAETIEPRSARSVDGRDYESERAQRTREEIQFL